MKSLVVAFFVLLTFGLSGCGGGSSYNGGSGSSGGSGATGMARNASTLGVLSGHLVDASGFSLYTTASSCTGGCITVWPPMDAPSSPTATGGLSPANIGIQSGQVTYKGSLLYYFESDTSPGQTMGNGVGGFTLATP